MRPVYVIATWDSEVNRWWAVGADVKGIAAEASTQEELCQNIQAAVADMFQDDPQLAKTYDSIRIFFNREVTLPLSD